VGAVCGASPDEKNDVTCVLHSGQRSLTFGFAWDVAAPCTSRRGMYCTVGCKKERVNDTLVEGGKSISGKRNGRVGLGLGLGHKNKAKESKKKARE
jgi:hypothetical protein